MTHFDYILLYYIDLIFIRAIEISIALLIVYLVVNLWERIHPSSNKDLSNPLY